MGGLASMDLKAFHELILQLDVEWQGGDYDILTRNCTHFADHLCRVMTGNGIPSRLTNLADVGVALANGAERMPGKGPSLRETIGAVEAESMSVADEPPANVVNSRKWRPGAENVPAELVSRGQRSRR